MTSPRHYRGTVTKGLKVLKDHFGTKAPEFALVLGSGLDHVAEKMKISSRLSFEKIPGLPKTTVAGHAGYCGMGEISSRKVLVYCGRFHHYEGHSLPILTLPIRMAGAWGVQNLIVTNAAGGIRKDLTPGSLMLISDHINGIGQNPLRGPNLDAYGPRFLDMSEVYDREHRQQAQKVAAESKIELKEGVYMAVPGPTYETPAEVRAFRSLGADAVGMSTVPEVIVARHHGMKVMGISTITNAAAGLDPGTTKLDHGDVLAVTKKANDRLWTLLSGWMR